MVINKSSHTSLLPIFSASLDMDPLSIADDDRMEKVNNFRFRKDGPETPIRKVDQAY